MWPSPTLPACCLTINDTPTISVLLQSICSVYVQVNGDPWADLRIHVWYFISGDCDKKHRGNAIQNWLNETCKNQETKKAAEKKKHTVWCMRNHNWKLSAFWTRHFPEHWNSAIYQKLVHLNSCHRRDIKTEYVGKALRGTEIMQVHVARDTSSARQRKSLSISGTDWLSKVIHKMDTATCIR